MASARARYFEVNNFGADGGYNDAWVNFKFGPIPFPFPNTAGRVRAVRYHDLHHLITGYTTDLVGEGEISAWEVGAGCASFPTALALNLSGIVLGCLMAPRRTWLAFVRGRQTRTLYGQPFDPLLERSVGDVRHEVGLDAAAKKPTLGDWVAFKTAVLGGVVIGTLIFAAALALLPIGIVALAVRRRR
jgi:hypothetical protein